MRKHAAPFSMNLATAIAAAIATAGMTAAPSPAVAAVPSYSASEAIGTYIVLFSEAPLATYDGSVVGIAAAPRRSGHGRAPKIDVKAASSRAYVSYLADRQRAFLDTAGAALGRALRATFQYRYALNGMAVEMTASEAARVAKMPGVASVSASRMLSLSTDSGPAWIGAPAIWDGTGTGGVAGTQGEGVIVGDIDTGINFGSPSFAASGADGYQAVNPNGAGNYLGTCAAGGVDAGKCNDKLIGAYTFVTSIPSGAPDLPGTATDFGGHGSHTASTAAGNHAQATTADGASVAVSGVAPHANLIMYKVCFEPPSNWTGGTCSNTGTAAAADQAVADGVDAINFSISGGTSPWTDPTSIAFRNAAAAGIFVATAAGNTANGDPNPAQPGTANHLEPWTISVGAATHDRLYSDSHVDVAGLGTLMGVKGGGGVNGPPLTGPASGTLAASADPEACTSFAPAPSTPGFIALVRRGTCSFAIKAGSAKAAGAAAVVIYDNIEEAPIPMNIAGATIPGIMISKADGTSLAAYLSAHAGTTATIDLTTPPNFSHDPSYGDIMGNFSLLGPAHGTASPWSLLKPDVSAPGLSILAAGADAAGTYLFMQGTSMATPHVTGSGALLRAVHPDWTAMEIKSALMLTAKHGVRKSTAAALADPFDTGAGRVDLTRAAASPLVMDETVANMEAANPASNGDLSALNEPSLSSAACAGACTFTRTFRNPTSTAQAFTASVLASNGSALAGSVSPASFTVAPGATQSLAITIDAGAAANAAWLFGAVELTPAAGEALSLPVAVRKSAAAQAPHIAVLPTSLQATQASGETTTQALTLSNTGDAALTWTIGAQPASVLLSNDAPGGSGTLLPAATDVDLQLDAGLGHNALGLGAGKPFLFLNRFTPDAAEFPFTLDRVDVEFLGSLNGGGNGAMIGEKFDVYVYRDDDDNPANGATILGSVKDVAVTVRDAVQGVDIPGGIAIQDPGDVLIAVVARQATGGNPATADGGPSVHRSWVATAASISDPPDFTAMQMLKVEDALSEFTFNFVLRGHGTRDGNGPCEALADVPWLSAAPTSGTTAAGASSSVTVTFDSTGLAAGTYSANVCVASNDPAHATLAVPVSMTVADGDDTIFKDGFDADGGAPACAPQQLFQDPSLEQEDAFWQNEDSEFGSSFCDVTCNDPDNAGPPITAHGGDIFAWLGGSKNAGTASIAQDVVIPEGQERWLNFWMIDQLDTVSTLTLKIDGSLVTDFPAGQVASTYAPKSFPIPAQYADGQSHTVSLDYARPSPGADFSGVMIDDVTLDCAAAPVRAVPVTTPVQASARSARH